MKRRFIENNMESKTAGTDKAIEKADRRAKNLEENPPLFKQELQEVLGVNCQEEADKMNDDILLKESKLLDEVIKLNDNVPDGIVYDADCILANIMEGSAYDFIGFAQDIFNIYKASSDKHAVTQMFYEFTGVEFHEFLERCKKEITR